MTRAARAKPPAPPDLRAVDGRVPGRRGRATRERLLACTAQLLEKGSYRDLRVIDIARCAGTSPATFYQYFPDVEAAIAVLARAMAEEAARISALITESRWRGASGYGTALRVVDEFLAFWERNRAILRVVDLSTAEGDLRFQNIRTHLLNEITVALRDVIDGFNAQRRRPAGSRARRPDPMAQAAALVSMLAHVASHRYGFEFWGIRTDRMRESMAALLFTGVTGVRAPE